MTNSSRDDAKPSLAVRGPDAITAKLDEVYAEEDSSLERGLAQAQGSSIPHEAW